MGGFIKSIEPNGVAARGELAPGDQLLSINGHPLRDVIDVQFYGAEDELWLEYQRGDTAHTARVRRDFGQPLGFEFEHPTFDIDIRRCNNLCPFCFVLQNAPRMRRTLYVKDDDYRYSFLYGHFVTLTNLSDEDWARLAEQRLSPLYVSVHATDPEIRRKCLRNPNAPDVMAQLRWLASHDIATHTQLVITPGLNDGAWVEKSVFDLAELYPHVQSVSVVPVGLTRHHKYGYRPHTVGEAGALLDRVHAWQHMLSSRLGVRFAHATDEWYLMTGRLPPRKRDYEGLALQENGLGMVRDFLDEWTRLKRKELRPVATGGKWQTTDNSLPSSVGLRPPPLKHTSATLATATLFAPTLRKAAQEFAHLTGAHLDVVAVNNEQLGKTITVAGLLMGRDVIEQLSSAALGPSSIAVLPRIMFDHPEGVSLDDLSPMDVARAIGKPVALADWMGDVMDALTGWNKLTFDPRAPDLSASAARQGGWAVEKYL